VHILHNGENVTKAHTIPRKPIVRYRRRWQWQRRRMRSPGTPQICSG